MTASRQHVYERLGASRGQFVDRCARESRAFGLASELRGAVALSGSQSVRPAFLLPAVIDKIAAGARSPTNLVTYLEGIRDVVKRNYGDDYDAVPGSVPAWRPKPWAKCCSATA